MHNSHLQSRATRSNIISNLKCKYAIQHSHSRKVETGVISRLEAKKNITATHFLERKTEALGTGMTNSHLQAGELRTNIMSMQEKWQGIVVTHSLVEYMHHG